MGSLISAGEIFGDEERKSIQEFYEKSGLGGKLPMWIALLISPVVLLVPNKLTGKRSWAMDGLLQVSSSIGVVEVLLTCGLRPPMA